MSLFPPDSPARWQAFWARVAKTQTHHAWRVLALVVLVCVAAGFLGSRLKVAAGFEHLLPDGFQSVLELNRVSKKTAGVSTLFIVIETPAGDQVDRPALRATSDELVVELRKLGEPWVGSADNGVHEALRYFERHGGLYAKQADLEKLRDDLEEYYQYQAAKKLDTLIDEDAPPPEVPLTPAEVKKRFGVAEVAGDRYPDGYFESADGHVHVITIRSKIFGGDLDQGREALRLVREVVERVDVKTKHPNARVSYAGDLYSGVAEVTAINKDITEVGIIGGILLACVVLIYYLRLRNLVIMLATITVGVVWTSGAAFLLVGKLNTATAFVFTIIAGTGINTGIIWMARYLEARRGGEDVQSAVATAHSETFMATLCATAASAASFFSLQLTAFRGFRELGRIGGVGLILCWVATLIALPAMLAVSERYSPITSKSTGFFRRAQGALEQSFGKPFAFVVERFPRVVTVVGLLIGIAGFAALGGYIKSDPLEYDMNNLRNDPRSRAEHDRVKKLALDVTGYVGEEGMAILVDDVKHVAPLREVLYQRRDAVPRELKPFDRIVALEDFLPPDQEAKIPVLLAIKKQVERARKNKAISDSDWPAVEKYLPPSDLKPITMNDLPEGLARPFTERDGTRGRLVYIVPNAEATWSDVRYLLRWAESYRRTELPDGTVVLGSGRAVIYADMFGAVMAAVPQAVIASFLAVAIVVLLTFRAGKPALQVLGALLLAVGWMALGLMMVKAKLNFLNFVALPLMFGTGVDYAVNVVWRATREGPGGALTAVRETGGAVVLCSLATCVGYLALIGSMNFAVRSLGVAALIGELSSLLTAMLVLPAAMLWWGKRAKRSAPSMDGAPADG